MTKKVDKETILKALQFARSCLEEARRNNAHESALMYWNDHIKLLESRLLQAQTRGN